MAKSDDDGDEIMVFRGPSAKSYMDRMFGSEGEEGEEEGDDEEDFEAFKAFRAAKKAGGTKKAAGARKGYFTKS